MLLWMVSSWYYEIQKHADYDITLASHIIRPGRTSHLMWYAAIQQLFAPNVVGSAGSICECGKPSFPSRLAVI